MRTKNAIYNNLTQGILQIIIVIFGLIIPRIMIGNYGSTLNGLVTSSKQLISNLAYLELGLSATLIFSLYEPIAKKNHSMINSMVTQSKNEYRKISIFYFIGVVLMSLLYPLILSENLKYSFVLILVFLTGLHGVLDFYTISKYKVFLHADQKSYILNIMTIITIILQNITIILLIVFKQNLLLIVFSPIIFLPLRSAFLWIYSKKHYKYIDFKSNHKDNVVKTNRGDAFLSGISNTLNITLPILLVSFIVSLEMASVFSVYSLVFLGLANIFGIFEAGMPAAFGNIYASGENELFKKTYDYYEYLLFIILTILYSSALVLIMPFVKLYVGDISDINYIFPSIGILFTTWSVFHNSRIPAGTIIYATGKWKMARGIYISHIVLLLSSTILFGYIFSINGILVGMIISSLYKVIRLTRLTSKSIIKIDYKKSLLRFIRVIIIIFVLSFPVYLNIVNMQVNNVYDWLISAVIIVVISVIFTVTINLIFDWETTKSLIKRYLKTKKRGV